MSKAAAAADVDVALASGAYARGAFGAGGAGAAASSAAAAAAAARCAVACGADETGDDGDDGGGLDRDAPGACEACELAARAAARDRCAGLSADPRTGAILARRTEGTAAFAKDWLAALLDDSAQKLRRPQDVGRSTPALAALLARTCGVNATRTKKPPAWHLGRLPAAWDVSASQESATAVRGGFVVLHAAHITSVEPPERALHVARSACRIALNSTTAWRLVAAPNGAAARDLAKLRCTEDADGLVVTGVQGGGADGGRHAVDVARAAAARAFELLWARTRDSTCPPPADTSFPGLVKHPPPAPS